MATTAQGNLEANLNPSDQKKPGASDKGKGRAVPGLGGTFTPEPSLGPDHARNEADLARKQADGSMSSIQEVTEENQEMGGVENITPSIEGPEASTTKSQLPEDAYDATDDEEQKETINIKEILKCQSDDHYGILGLEDKYDDPMHEIIAIERAVWNRGTNLHPKFNQSEGAKEAFKMVCDAGRALGCSEDVLDEVNNYDGDGEADNEDGVELPFPTEFVMRIYNEATPHIHNLQAYPKAPSLHKKIETFNDRIRTQNKVDGCPADQWVIDYKSLAEFYTEADPYFDNYDRDPSQKHFNEGMQFRNRVDEFLTKHYYPNWEVNTTNRALRNKTKTSKQTPSASSSSSAQTPRPPASATSTVQAPKTQISGPSPQITAPTTVPTTGTGRTVGGERQKEKPLIATRSSASTSANTGTWKPGLTEKGERILAMAPVESEDATKKLRIMRCKFVVEKKGEKNGIAFEDTVEIGEKATKGYLEDLPEAQRVDIRCKAKKYTIKYRQGFRRIIGVTAVESDNARIFPPIALAAEYDHGLLLILNRTSWRDIWKSKADMMIEDFFVSNELDIPWAKRAKRPGCSQYSEPQNDSGQFRSFRHLDRGRDSEVRIRRRSSSVRSTASYLSDEGLERLEALEKKLDSLSGLEQRLTAGFTASVEGLMARIPQLRAV